MPDPARHQTISSADDLLRAWAAAGHLGSEDRERAANVIISAWQARELPVYSRVIIGVGALIAAACFIGFLHAAGLVDWQSPRGLILWGLALAAAAVTLDRVVRGSGRLAMKSFAIQTSFCAMTAGKILFVLGVTDLMDDDDGWGVTGAIIIATVSTYFIYDLYADRIAWSLAALLAPFLTLYGGSHLDMVETILLDGWFVAVLVVVAWAFTVGTPGRLMGPFAYAAATALCVATMMLPTGFQGELHSAVAVVNAVLATGLVAAIAWAAGGVRKLAVPPLFLAVLGAAVLGAVSAPGILLSLLQMVLGHARYDRILLSMGLLLPAFISHYYYMLDLSLLDKSMVLIASGLMLVAGSGYMYACGLDRETRQ